ncbi:MAG TPA: acetate/propionate family kinase [Candidatus Binataceae bacterium]|nr:acetate/propionate family kinase [Candidatus Binataceae bacterium]
MAAVPTTRIYLPDAMLALVFNCGSSSLKFELVELDDSARRKRSARGLVEEISGRSRYTFTDFRGSTSTERVKFKDHTAAARFALSRLMSTDSSLSEALDVVVHRVVHGGQIEQPRVVDGRVLRTLRSASRFAPLHNPPAIAVIQATRSVLKKTPAVVMPDTAFHSTLPPVAHTYALPHALVRRWGIRRYGFHGIGHAWMAERYAELRNRPVASLNLVTMHLGSGCSACAISGGKSVDTSMGMTPLEGLMMATRPGDIDPGVLTYLVSERKLRPKALEQILNHKSGLLGVSGVSSDLRRVRAAAGSGNGRAQLAISLMAYRVRKYLGAYLTLAGQPHGVLFGGGVGEHDDQLRHEALSGLEWLGIELDRAANKAANGREARISSARSRIPVWVIPLDEELFLERAGLRLIVHPPGGSSDRRDAGFPANSPE